MIAIGKEGEVLKIEQLERFLVVANYLNFTTAAEKLYVGQSTISRQIASLEEELGVTLLIRGSRNVELTDAGRVLQAEATKLLNSLEQMKDRVQEAGRGTSGRLRITTIPAYIPVLSDIQRLCLNKYPNLHLSFSQESYDEITHLLDRSTYDIGLTFSFWIPNNSDYGTTDLYSENFCVLCGKQHWAAAHEEEGLYIDQLRDEDFVFGRDALHLMAHPYDFSNSIVANPSNSAFASMEDMLMQLNISNSVALMPDVVARYVKSNLVCVPLKDEDLIHTLTLIWRKDNSSPSLSRFLDIVEDFKASRVKDVCPRK